MVLIIIFKALHTTRLDYLWGGPPSPKNISPPHSLPQSSYVPGFLFQILSPFGTQEACLTGLCSNLSPHTPSNNKLQLGLPLGKQLRSGFSPRHLGPTDLVVLLWCQLLFYILYFIFLFINLHALTLGGRGLVGLQFVFCCCVPPRVM